jgi:hypothetical protein
MDGWPGLELPVSNCLPAFLLQLSLPFPFFFFFARVNMN